MGGRKKSGPAERGPDDEYEALRARLVTALRRHPGDTRSLMRAAAALSRMAAAEQRMSPKKGEELAENLRRVLGRFGDIMLPADDYGEGDPQGGEEGGSE